MNTFKNKPRTASIPKIFIQQPPKASKTRHNRIKRLSGIYTSSKRHSSTSSGTKSFNSKSPNSPNHTKLNKGQIEHLKSLHTTAGRLQSQSFLIEGRKLIESICIHQDGFLKPKEIYLTLEQYEKFTKLLETGSNSSNSTNISSNRLGLNGDGVGLRDSNNLLSLSAKLDQYRQSSFLSKSTQQPWVVQGNNGMLVPPNLHSLQKQEIGLTNSQIKLYRHILSHGNIIEGALLGRIGQFKSTQGIIAEFDFLPNVLHFENNPQNYSQNDQDFLPVNNRKHNTSTRNIGTLANPKFPQDPPQHSPPPAQHSNSLPSSPQTRSKPSSDWSWANGGLILAGISDPANLAAIIRTAHVFGLDQIVIIDGCDVYNHKALSASSGSIGHVSILSCHGGQFVHFFKEMEMIDNNNFQKMFKNEQNIEQNDQIPTLQKALTNTTLSQPYLIGMTPTRGLDLNQVPKSLQGHIMAISTPPPSDSMDNSSIKAAGAHQFKQQNLPWLVIGSEAFGLPLQLEELLHNSATIPRKNDFVDSLNASIAASIGLYVIKQ